MYVYTHMYTHLGACVYLCDSHTCNVKCFPSNSMPGMVSETRMGSFASANCALSPTGKVVVATLPTVPVTRLPPTLAAMTEIALLTCSEVHISASPALPVPWLPLM